MASGGSYWHIVSPGGRLAALYRRTRLFSGDKSRESYGVTWPENEPAAREGVSAEVEVDSGLLRIR